jgi:MFS family permease
MIVSALYTWLSTRFASEYGLLPDRAAAVAATVPGGLRRHDGLRPPRRRRFEAGPTGAAAGAAVLAIVTLALLTTAFAAVGPGIAQLLLIAIGGATMTGAVGPVAAVVVDVVHPALRATAISRMVVVVQNVGGLAVGPVLTGLLSDRFGVTAALAAMPVLCAVAAGTFWYGSRYYVRDRDAGPVAEPAVPGFPPEVDK